MTPSTRCCRCFLRVAVCAVLRRADAARGVGEMRIERLAAVTFRRDRLLLRIYPFAICILRADHDRARRTDHGHPIFFHRAVEPEHENVVAHDLRVVGREIAIGHPFEFVLRDPLVGLHRQVATETARRPGGVADLAIHPAVVVRQPAATFVRRGGDRAPGLAVAASVFA